MIIGRAILILVHWSLTLLFELLANPLFRSCSGIEIDIQAHRARIFKAFGKFKFGTWQDTASFSGVLFKYVNESQIMSSRGSSNNVRLRSYDLVFTGNEKQMNFHDFTDHSLARKVAAVMVKSWNLTLVDEFDMIKQRVVSDHLPKEVEYRYE